MSADADTAWPVQVRGLFPEAPEFLLGRAAARSPVFAVNDAAGGQRVLIGSAAGTERDDVTRRAAGELLERMHNVLAGHRAVRRAVVASYTALRRAGRPALDPWAWPDLQQAADAREMEVEWVEGASLTGAGRLLVPACAVYLAYRPPAGGAAPPPPGSTGLAAHRTDAAARRHALLEILERDLLWHAWYADGPRLVPCGPTPLGAPLRRVLDALGLRDRCMVLPGPAGAACVVACLSDADGARQSFGARATDGAPAAAAASAVQEALMVRWSMGTPSARTAWTRLRADPGHRPRGPLEHALHTFHRQDSLAHLLGGAVEGAWRTPSAPPEAPELPRLLAEHTGEDVVEVPTTASGLGDDDTAVVRVVAPGARRLPVDEPPHAASARPQPPHPLG
ncbi:YcaO-like family protein [Kitasatospora sp. NPDC058046]|uniref:YcaO-like family protein n=1 Tax=Kitasatospora sp. NPDC058046 TaxID=3346312 RepID=UPI0036D99646